MGAVAVASEATGVMAELNENGDTKFMWDKKNKVETKAAKAHFEGLMKKGFAAFTVVGKDAKKGVKITRFNPDAERVILVPPMAGG